MSDPVATVVITTRNRKEELCNAIESCMTQDVEIEVLVIDDASDDGTCELVRSRFPWVRIERSELFRGYIVQRNLAARMARAPVIVSIDDDAYFTSPETVRRAVESLQAPEIGAVALPFSNILASPTVMQIAPDDQRMYVTSWFIGTAHALNRDLFLKIGGYREILYYQWEEVDFCYRLLDSGKFTRVGTGAPIHHTVSPKRVQSRVIEYGERNRVLTASLNFPARALPRRYAGCVYRGVRALPDAVTRGATVKGMLRGFGASVRYINQRSAISKTAFHRFQALERRGPLPIEDVLAIL